MTTLFLVRGLPGSGKSTLAERLCPRRAIAADDYFVNGGEYVFNRYLLAEAHEDCLNRARALLNSGDCAVANTFCKGWEVQPYVKLAASLNVKLVIISLFDGGVSDDTLHERNVHGVPIETIRRMRASYEHNINLEDNK